MNITKIKQYSFSQLLIIAFYKFGYKTLLFIECLRIKIRESTFLDYKGCYHNKNISSFSVFFDRCDKTDSRIIRNEADEILRGIVTVFNTKVKFNPEIDWLRDPIGKNYWSDKVFFAKAKTVEKDLNDVKYVLEVNKLNHLVRVALAYYHTKEGKYLEYLNKSIKGFIRCVPYEKSVVNRIIMDQGFRTINLIQISLLCWEDSYFQKFVYPDIHVLLLGYERQMRKFNTPRWFKTGNGVNHTTGEMVGLIITQLWLSQLNNITYKSNIEKEFHFLVENLDITIAPSGAYLEQSANYSRVVLEFLILFEIFINELYFKDNKTKNYYSYKYRERLENYISVLLFNGKLPNFGDNDDARVLWSFINDKNDLSYLGIPNSKNGYKPSIITDYLDGAQWIFKSNDENQVQIFTRVGKFAFLKEGAAVHVHNDILAVLLSINGKEVFIDKGTSFYNSGRDVKFKYMSTAAHNTIYIDGIEMADKLPVGYKNYPYSEVFKSTDSIFSAVLKYKDITHYRKINYTKNSISIIDEVDVLKSEGHASMSFLLAEDILIKQITNNQVMLIQSECRKSIKIIFKGFTSIQIEDSVYYPSYAVERKTKAIRCFFNFNNSKKLVSNICL